MLARAVSEYDGCFYIGDAPARPLSLRVAPESLAGAGGRSESLPIALSRQEPTAYGLKIAIFMEES